MGAMNWYQIDILTCMAALTMGKALKFHASHHEDTLKFIMLNVLGL